MLPAAVILAAASGLVLSAEAPARKAGTYTDGLYGFSISAPEFPEAAKGGKVMSVAMLAPAENGFSANLNVVIIPGKTSRKEVIDNNEGQIKAAGWKKNSTKELTASGKDAVLFDYEGKMPGQSVEMHFLCLIVVDEDRQMVIACTALKSNFDKYEKTFRACLDSFKLDK